MEDRQEKMGIVLYLSLFFVARSSVAQISKKKDNGQTWCCKNKHMDL